MEKFHIHLFFLVSGEPFDKLRALRAVSSKQRFWAYQ